MSQPPASAPKRPTGVPDQWDFQTEVKSIKLGDATNVMSYPLVWVWLQREQRWQLATHRTWSKTASGWWGAVDIPGNATEYVHAWRLHQVT